ncbi:hypothetical protein [Mitsuokella sp.]|uniref:hypothetical protein n=1 Tax=unclassified Mitsuokella TaxID=2637239 RepID=UPI003D7F0664
MSEQRNYDDIINLPHPVSKHHPQMPREKRAAQFSPFAALTGYDDILAESTRPLVQRIELSDDEKEQLDRRMQELMARIQKHPKVTITYFQQDMTADGGTYITATGRLQKIDTVRHCLLLEGSQWICLTDVLFFNNYNC